MLASRAALVAVLTSASLLSAACAQAPASTRVEPSPRPSISGSTSPPRTTVTKTPHYKNKAGKKIQKEGKRQFKKKRRKGPRHWF